MSSITDAQPAGSDVDPSVRPQDDLFRHVNGHWLATTEIPDDRAVDGAFVRLRDESEAECRAIVEAAAAASAAGRAEPGSVQQKIGDLYAGFMDTERIEALGATPLEPELAAVDAVTDHAGLVRLLGAFERSGVGGPFAYWVDTDNAKSDEYVVYLTQAGLGLPDESYYREEQYAGIREAYVGHVERILTLGGRPDPAGSAQRVLALETALAAHHWDRVRNRDANAHLQQARPRGPGGAAAGRSTWRAGWARRSCPTPRSRRSSSASRATSRAWPRSCWRRRWGPGASGWAGASCTRPRSFLSADFVDGELRLLRHDAHRRPAAARALEARRRARRGRPRRGAGRALRRRALPARPPRPAWRSWWRTWSRPTARTSRPWTG